MLRMIVAAAALALLGACASQNEPTPQQALAEDGREIAEAQCARCHAVGPIGESPNPQAPPFRYILADYHGDVLEQELIEGIRVNHDMPEFQFNPQGVDALVAYLRSIQQPPPPEH